MTTLPANPYAGVMVMMEVFPMLTPGELMTTAVLVTEKVGGGGAVMTTEWVPLRGT